MIATTAHPNGSAPRHRAQRLGARAGGAGLVDVAYADHDTPLGTVRLAATSAGIVRVGLPSDDRDAMLEELARGVSARVLRADDPALAAARHQLDEYFAARRRTFELRLDWTLAGAFSRRVLRATARVAYGTTASYGDVAAAAGAPRAVRAAGTALATNPLALLVPCHRVRRADGSLGRYRGGTAAKAWLLALEGAG